MNELPAAPATPPVPDGPATFEASFGAAEHAAFAFLVDEHGFHVAERQVERAGSAIGVLGRVVYRSAASPEGRSRAVELTIAPLRLELDLRVSRTASPPCPVEELHALDGRGSFPGRQHGLYDAMHDPEQLLAEFMRMAGVLRACGSRFFDDDPDLWEDLEERRARRAEDEEIRHLLAWSKELFRAREWERVVELLSPIELRLGSTASARLAYARRKAGRVPGDGLVIDDPASRRRIGPRNR